MSKPTYNLPTPIGNLVLIPTEQGHIYAEGTVLTVRGKTQRLTFHFYLWGHGGWNLGLESEQDYQRRNHCYSNDATTAFKDKAIQMVLPELNAWAKSANGVTALKLAEDDHREAALKNRREQIESHQQAIEQLQTEVERLEAGEHLSSYSEVKSYTFGIKPS